MAAVRRNILTNAGARQKYVDGVLRLKRDFPGTTTAQLGIAGPARPVSTYDLFVAWHHRAMSTLTPPGNGSGRNAAHMGPVFMPWHRWMLLLFEQHLQRVLADTNFGLPYWDWAADGTRPASQQPQLPIWGTSAMGGSGNPIASGPFRFDPANAQSFRVTIDIDPNNVLRQVNPRGLRRSLGGVALPTTTQARAALQLTPYDATPWDATSAGFRNRVEGWRPNPGPGLHNRVHVFVGGDMGLATSPNDPVFYLNHCNVDRLWESWMTQHGRTYLPPQTASATLTRHRINDPMFPLVAPPRTPAEMLSVSAIYSYDSLGV
jgi:tyrosinase